MKTTKNKIGKQEFEFLTRDDMERLIYLNTDIWITPELKHFKRDLLKRANEGVDGEVSPLK